jgi:hypothetical protein
VLREADKGVIDLAKAAERLRDPARWDRPDVSVSSAPAGTYQFDLVNLDHERVPWQGPIDRDGACERVATTRRSRGQSKQRAHFTVK